MHRVHHHLTLTALLGVSLCSATGCTSSRSQHSTSAVLNPPVPAVMQQQAMSALDLAIPESNGSMDRSDIKLTSFLMQENETAAKPAFVPAADPANSESQKSLLAMLPNDVLNSTLSQNDFIGMAYTSNPALIQAQDSVAEAAGIYTQVGLKANPTISYFADEIGNEGAAGLHGVQVSQTFVRGNKLNWNRCVQAHDVNRMKWDQQTQRQRLETDVRRSFYKALTAQQKLAQAQQFRTQAEKAVEIANQRLEAQEGTRPDLLQSQILVDQIDLTIRESELMWNAAWSELVSNVGQPNLSPSQLTGEFLTPVHVELESVYQQILEGSPQIASAMTRIDRARTNLERQRLQPIPNLQTQFGVGHDDSTGDAFASLQVGVALPVHNANQGNIRAAHAEYSAAIQNLERLKLQLRRDLADVIKRYEVAAINVTRFETEILPKAEESLQLVESAYTAGELEFLRVLTARQALFQFQQKLVEARGELSMAQAELDGLLLTDALGTAVDYSGDDGLRDQTFSNQ